MSVRITMEPVAWRMIKKVEAITPSKIAVCYDGFMLNFLYLHRNKRWYEVLKPCLLEDGKGIHCQIVVGDALCNYTQKTRRMQNLLRHFRIKHKQESRQMGLFENKPEPSDGDQSQNVTEEQLDEHVGPLKTEVQEG